MNFLVSNHIWLISSCSPPDEETTMGMDANKPGN